MNKENITKWIEALRSGNYTQGRGRLHLTRTTDGVDRFCCLGVACDLYRQEHQIEKVVLNNGTIMYGNERESNYLPVEVRKWLETNDPNNPFAITSIEQFLAKLNDNGKSFNEIAAIIEGRMNDER